MSDLRETEHARMIREQEESAMSIDPGERCRIATQRIIDRIGSVGPESIEGAVTRIIAYLDDEDASRLRAASWVADADSQGHVTYLKTLLRSAIETMRKAKNSGFAEIAAFCVEGRLSAARDMAVSWIAEMEAQASALEDDHG